tara:strand:+ start:80 stop:1399 length:1320 start_codon:yes stop_codon:yes gene_type:complete
MSTKTIVSQSTPSGFSAIAIVRLSGSKALKIAAVLSKKGTPFGTKKPTKLPVFIGGKKIDVALFTAFLSPNSYTGEDIVEISCHGNIYICEAILNECVRLGARLAKPGEYTKRAFLNGKINLLQAESVAQLITAKSIEAAEQQIKNLAGGATKKIKTLKEKILSCLSHIEYELDVSENTEINKKTLSTITNSLSDCLKKTEALKGSFELGSALSYGIKIVFVGKPNVGKSTLVNKILGEEKSITSKKPGTTRDLISTKTVLSGIPTTLVDTAGIHTTKNDIESEGIRRALLETESSDLIISLFSWDLEPVDFKEFRNVINVYNKLDIKPYRGKRKRVYSISATKGTGVKQLLNHIIKRVGTLKKNGAEPLITTIRQKNAITEVGVCVSKALEIFNQEKPEIEIAAYEIRSAVSNIDLITGKTTTNDILEKVFSTFCVGK